MPALRQIAVPAETAPPENVQAGWGAFFFSLSVSTYLISLAASEAFLIAAASVYAFTWARARLIRKTQPRSHGEFPPIQWPLALFCVFSILSIVGSENPEVGWLTVRKLALLGILPLAVNIIDSASRLRNLYRVLFVESALAGSVALGQFARHYRAARAVFSYGSHGSPGLQASGGIDLYMTNERIRGFMGHWMNFSGQQMLVFAALLAFLLLRLRRGDPGPRGALPSDREAVREGKVVWWIAAAVVGISIALSLTRGVWLGCLAAAIYLVARSRPRWLWALPVALLAAYLAAPSVTRQRARTLLHPSSDPTIASRLEMWQAGLRMIRKHPWFGVGLDNIREVYPLYLPPGQTPRVDYHDHLHNDFLQLAAERGLPCLAAWVWLMAALIGSSWKIRRRWARGSGEAGETREAREVWLADAAIAAGLAFLVEGCFEYNFGTSPVLMVFLFIASAPFVVERLERPGL